MLEAWLRQQARGQILRREWHGRQTCEASSCFNALYLTYLGIAQRGAVILLWPASLTHAVLTVLFARAWLFGRHIEK